MSKQQWLNLVEYIFIACAVAITVAAIITKQGIFAVIFPILSIGLILINRQRFDRLNHKKKAEKENFIEIDRRTQQIKEFQQTVEQVSNSVVKDISSSKNNARFLNSEEKLISLLKDRNWKEANEETAKILLRLAEKQLDDSLNNEDIKKLPVEELKTLDRLWSTYSNGRFSWLVQKQIWQELGGRVRVYDLQIYEKWSKKVGWRVVNEWLPYIELDFTDEAPVGHFPAISLKWSSWGSAWCGIETVMLFSKIDAP